MESESLIVAKKVWETRLTICEEVDEVRLRVQDTKVTCTQAKGR